MEENVMELQFIVPSDEEILDALGVSPVPEGDDPTVRVLTLTTAAGGEVLISYDILGRSFRVRSSVNQMIQLDLLVESATRLGITADKGECCFRVTIRSADLAGELEVEIGSHVMVRQTLLMV